jgi:hypothetical protein
MCIQKHIQLLKAEYNTTNLNAAYGHFNRGTDRCANIIYSKLNRTYLPIIVRRHKPYKT